MNKNGAGNGEVVSSKGISDVVTIKELRKKYGIRLSKETRKEGKGISGTIVFKDNNNKEVEYPFVVAAPKWLRDVERNKDGKVINVKSRSPEDEKFTITDFHILTMPVAVEGHENISERDKNLARQQLEEIKSTVHRSAGAEIEGELTLGNDPLTENNKEQVNKKISKLFAKYRQELCQTQFEHNADIMGATPDELRRVFHDTVKEMIEEAASEGLLVPFLSASPLAHDMENFNSLSPAESQTYGPYVQNVASGLYQYFVKEFVESGKIDPQVRKAWKQIQEKQTEIYRTDFSEENILLKYNDIRYWLMNSYHTSFDLAVDEEGRPSEHVVKGFSNLSFAFRSLIIGLNFSGGHAFGTDIVLEDGTVVLDARHLLNLTLPSSYPPNYVEAEEDLLARAINATEQGEVNVAARGSYVCTVNGVDYYNLHGDARLRQEIELAKVIAARKSNRNPNISDVDIIRGLSRKYTRLESTVRSANPDFRKYGDSVGIQLVLKSAASVAVSEGYNDVFEWIKDKVYEGESNESLKNGTNTDDLVEELMQLQRGVFPTEKLNIFSDIFDYLEQHEYLNTSTIQAVEHGLEALNNFGVFSKGEVHADKTAIEKYNLYMSENVSNWGDLSNSLSNEEILEILMDLDLGIITEEQDLNMTRGQLLAWLAEVTAMLQVSNNYYDILNIIKDVKYNKNKIIE